MALLVLLALGSMALGGMTEGRRWAVVAWLMITLSLPLLFIGYLGWSQRYWHLAMALITLHGVCVALGWGRVRALKPVEETHG
ncbi:hypothetical protein D3C81_1238640 [compost metagenome]